MIIIMPFTSTAQVYLDQEAVKSYDFEEYVKLDSFYSYNPETVTYVEYNFGAITLKYVYDMFANITHINPNTSNVKLNIYKPGAKNAKAFSYIDIYLEANSFIIPETWYKYYENCFNEFFVGLSMHSVTSKLTKKKQITYVDSAHNVEFNIYFYREVDRYCMQILVNEKDVQFEKQIANENLASK